ncbi:MAG TPA: YhfZ family protein, partial [Candidatus Limnocylindrales bacterium]
MTHRTTKSEELRQQLAERLLQAVPGTALPPIRTLAASFGASVGATQIALVTLANEGIVSLDSRPGRGGTLLARDVGRLFGEAARTPLLVAMPVSSSGLINGLATAIRSSLLAAGVETYLTFFRGPTRRLSELVEGRCNVAVMSR